MDIIVDSKGFACPMPVIKLKKALTQYPDKSCVFLLALTDTGGMKDVPAFCRQQALEWALQQEKPFIEFKVWRKSDVFLCEGGG
ncbi:MAG: sulfurtransferase TusA family protein [Thiomicrorhabdus sp.]|nr:sulfurtransferase TusA family protein [Thiomicrorhabdus sp.]